MATTTAQPESEAGGGFLQLLYQGGELLAAGNVAEAKDYLEKALTIQPDNEKGKNLLGLTYFKLGLFERAGHLYETLVQENPADPTLRVNLGLVYLKSNELPRAIHEFATATELAPDHTKAHNYLGLALAQSGQYEKAREHFVLAGSDAMAEKMSQALAAGLGSASPSDGVAAMPVEQGASSFDAGANVGESGFPSAAAYEQLSDQAGGWEGEASFDGIDGHPAPLGEQAGFDDDGPTQPQYERSARPAPVTVFPSAAPIPQIASGPSEWIPSDYQAASAPPLPPPSARLADLAPSLRILGQAPIEPFEVRPDLVLISVRGELLTRLSGLIAYGGVLDFKPERKRFRGRLTDRSFGDGAEQMTRAKGNGILMLDPQKRMFLATDVGGESAYFREDVVFAFEEALAFENGRLPSDMTPDLDLVYLRGQGQVLLCPGGPLRSVEVTSVRPVTVPLENLVGWYGGLTPRIAILAFDENGKVIRAGVELSGDGFLLFSSPLS
ncbi:MAG TPA: tetratricopeptide repeat protein [Myxococcaceae bacterium]|nr:tetratricopeptide repeat protein [Myxococcaceae bacterium]